MHHGTRTMHGRCDSVGANAKLRNPHVCRAAVCRRIESRSEEKCRQRPNHSAGTSTIGRRRRAGPTVFDVSKSVMRVEVHAAVADPWNSEVG